LCRECVITNVIIPFLLHFFPLVHPLYENCRIFVRVVANTDTGFREDDDYSVGSETRYISFFFE